MAISSGWRGEKKEVRGKKNLCMRYGQLGKCLKVGVCKELKYVEEMRVLSFLLTTNHPVPPLAVCRHQMILGPERSCKRKWEEIWSIWWHYKGRRWFAAFIKTWSRLHHLLMTRTLLSHLVTVHWMSHQSLSPAEPVICLTLGVRGSLQQSSKLILLWKVKYLQVGKFLKISHVLHELISMSLIFYVASDMKILGPFVFLLLLGGLWCQNNRNAKATGKSTKKSSGIQQGDAGQSASAADVTSGSTGRTGSTSRNTGGSAESRQEGAAGTRGAGQQTDDMRLHYLTNTQVTCNDGTVAGWEVLVVFAL